MSFQTDDPGDVARPLPITLSFEEPSSPPPSLIGQVANTTTGGATTGGATTGGFTTASIVSPSVGAEPTVVDATVVQNDEAWGDLLKYQVQCCGMRIGLRQAKRLMTLMGGMILVLTCCIVGAAVMVSAGDVHEPAGQVKPPPREQSNGMVPEQKDEREEEPTIADPCSPSPCHHGGECDILDEARGTYVCRCPTGKVGTHCEVNLETCASTPCANQAKCIDGADEFYCVCAEGFAGATCEEDLLAEELARCEKLKCLNSGECHPEGQTGRVLCECPIGYGGDRCENRHKDIPIGHGIDITSVLKNDGEFALKFAGIFSGRNRSGLVVSDAAERPDAFTQFYRSPDEFSRHIVREFGLPYSGGMLAADAYIAQVRKASFTAKRRKMFGRSESRLITEKKQYIACDDAISIFNGTSVWGCLALHEGFVEAVQSLPDKMDSSKQLEAYYEFLVTYGTHYIAEEAYGAAIHADYLAEPASADKAESIGVQAHAMFAQFLRQGNFTMQGFDPGSEHMLRRQIPSISCVDFRIVGADADEPELIAIKLRPMHVLASAVSQTKMLLLEQATKMLLGQCLPLEGHKVNGVLNGAVCSNRGSCYSESQGAVKGTCACDSGFHGNECENKACPSAIPNKVCSGNGYCDQKTGLCSCFKVNGTTAVVQGEACSSCVHGYETVAVGQKHAPTHISCKDVNECEGGNRQVCGDTHATCTNTLGGHHCTCNKGYSRVADKSCQPTKCLSNTPKHSVTSCTGHVGDKCVVRCKAGFISTNPAVCGEDGKWRQGICLHECPTLDISGDCATSGNQKYKIQEHMINERPHYKSADGRYNMYYDSSRNAWLLDDDLDAHAIHGLIRNVQDDFPMGKQLWIIYCGPRWGFTQLVFNIACSGICLDTCDGESDNHVCDDGGKQGVKSKCTWGTDCDDCGARKPNDADACKEEPDGHGHTCLQYHENAGYSCNDLVRKYHINCLCTCPDLYKNHQVQGGRRILGQQQASVMPGGGASTREGQQDEDDTIYRTIEFDEFPRHPAGPPGIMPL